MPEFNYKAHIFISFYYWAQFYVQNQKKTCFIWITLVAISGVQCHKEITYSY